MVIKFIIVWYLIYSYCSERREHSILVKNQLLSGIFLVLSSQYILIFLLLQEVYTILSRISVIHAFDIFSVLEALESVRQRMHNQVMTKFPIGDALVCV